MNLDPLNQMPVQLMKEFAEGWEATVGTRFAGEVEAAFVAGMAAGLGLSIDKPLEKIAEMLLQVQDISETKVQLLELGIG